MGLKDITIRELTEDDFLEVSRWFSARKWSHAPAKDILPPLAYVAELDGVLLSVVWVYVTNCGLVLLDWFATNPESGSRGIISVKKLTKYVVGVMEESGTTTACISYTHNDKLAEYLDKKCGFKKDSMKVNMCYKRLGG